MTVTARQDIETLLRRTADEVNAALRGALSRCEAVSPRLLEAARYCIDAGGKRVRPALVLWSCEVCGGTRQAALPAAVAIEFVHTFSLIHDDLPALDNDDLRRGKPTCHKVFDEATAILAGDALLTMAFEVLARDVADPDSAVSMIRELASAAGPAGMIGGEAMDVEGESAAPDRDLVHRIHSAKTARLLQAACRLGGLAARAGPETISALGTYGHALGLAFQIADDLLDATADVEQLGKRTGKDAPAGKQTYLRVVSMEEARRKARHYADKAAAALQPFGSGGTPLAALARYVIERDA
ncbi:MAG: polyprenyl synthetase family protein [Planctomycetota bacterium]